MNYEIQPFLSQEKEGFVPTTAPHSVFIELLCACLVSTLLQNLITKDLSVGKGCFFAVLRLGK